MHWIRFGKRYANSFGVSFAGTKVKDVTGVVPREFIVHHIVGAYMAVLTWWLDHGAKLPPRQMDEFFRSLMSKSIASSRS